MWVDIVMFAVIAIAIGVRLFKTLGKVDENDISFKFNRAQQSKSNPDKSDKDIIDLRSKDFLSVPESKDQENQISIEKEKKDLDVLGEITSDQIVQTIKNIKNIDKSFYISEFLEKAEKAFEIIIKNYSECDLKALEKLLSKELYNKFLGKIHNFEKEGKKQSIVIESISAIKIEQVLLDNKNNVSIELRFSSLQFITTTDKDHKFISGNQDSSVTVEDRWVFGKNLKHKSPMWTLTEVK